MPQPPGIQEPDNTSYGKPNKIEDLTSSYKAHFYLVSTREIWQPQTQSQSTTTKITTTFVSNNSNEKQKQDNTRGTALSTQAPNLLASLPDNEQKKALSFYFLRDAKLSLASSLLKRYFICKSLSVRWEDVGAFSRKGDPKHGKPCYVSPSLPSSSKKAREKGEVRSRLEALTLEDGAEASRAAEKEGEKKERWTVDFNISHQAGLVVLAGYRYNDSRSSELNSNIEAGSDINRIGGAKTQKQEISVGVDVTCTSERRDRDLKWIRGEDESKSNGAGRTDEQKGFEEFVDMHAEVFGAGDVEGMKGSLLNSSGTLGIGRSKQGTEKELEHKLRRFYAYWALKEAYVKMEGEALLATWLRDVEFRNVRVPLACSSFISSGEKEAERGGEEKEVRGQQWGETVEGIEVWVRGKRRKDVQLFLQAFEDDYLVATSVVADVVVGPPIFDVLDIQREVESLRLD